MADINVGQISEALNDKTDRDFNNMNPSALSKETFIDWSMPDYSAGVAITSGFIAPCDGIISVFCFAGSSGQQAIVSINGMELAGSGSGGGHVSTCCQLPVNKGDVVTMKNSSGINNNFFPLKGAN